MRATLCDLLERAGFRVATAANGREALDSLRGGPSPSVVLLDLMMPVMNGWEFREQQTRDAELAGIPVVILSADSRAEMKAKTLGVEGWLRKPIDPQRLLELLERYASS